MSEIWFIRHGETDWNIAGRLQGWQDTALNDTGKAQAERLAERLRDNAAHTSFAAIYSSDLQRAHATAKVLGEAIALPVLIEPGMRERNFGVLEGLLYNSIDQESPEAAAAWKSRDPDRPVEGGETLGEFYARIVATVESLAQRHTGERILVVTHGGALDIIWRQASGIALSERRHTRMLNAAINRVRVGAQGWSMLDWGDARHIEETRDDIV
jgi:probable phosphoglycerate mutase